MKTIEYKPYNNNPEFFKDFNKEIKDFNKEIKENRNKLLRLEEISHSQWLEADYIKIEYITPISWEYDDIIESFFDLVNGLITYVETKPTRIEVHTGIKEASENDWSLLRNTFNNSDITFKEIVKWKNTGIKFVFTFELNSFLSFEIKT